jgi:hypothetical protein
MTTSVIQQQSFAPTRAFALHYWLAAFAIVLAVVSAAAFAQRASEAFKARLSPLGVTNSTVTLITGSGSVTAVLDGARLRIEATYAGLNGAATAANIRRGAKGIPGPVIFELAVPKASAGKIEAVLELNAEQLTDLRAGRLYLQVHSERAPDGSIRGWLLK